MKRKTNGPTRSGSLKKPKPIKRRTKPGKRDSQIAKFKNCTPNSNVPQLFTDVTHVGWVNSPLILGRLNTVRDCENSVIFEFEQGKRKYDVWSSKNGEWGKKNKQLLKKGYNYVVEGTMRVQTKSTKKYSRSSNSNFRFRVLLSRIRVVEKEKAMLAPGIGDGFFQQMNHFIIAEKPFTLSVEQVEIISGDVRRYMGCEICYAGISKADEKDDKFRCNLCRLKFNDTSIKQRKICLIIRDIRLKDRKGNVLDNVVCFQKGCEGLFGTNVVQRLCAASSDLIARNKFATLIGTFIETATIRHQGPTGSLKTTNESRIIIENIVVKAPATDEDDSEDGENSNGIIPTVVDDIVSSYLCPCELDEDEDDVIASTANANNIQRLDSSAPLVNEFMDRTVVRNYTARRYNLTAASDGYLGLALVINIEKYNSGRVRKGSKHNVKTLMSMLPEIGFRVFRDNAVCNVNLKEFEETIKAFKEELVKMKYSSLIFVLMSHGVLFNVRLSDNTRINVYKDILPKFSDKGFPQFREKPRICILNACQYFRADDVIDCVGFEADESEIFPDMLVCLPCYPGVKAKRNRKTGSYFIEVLAKVFREKRNSMHLEEMMKEVQERMLKMPRFGKENKTAANIPVYKPMLFRYPLYFQAS